MKVINIHSLDTKINIPLFIDRYGYGTLENKIKILLNSIYNKDIKFNLEETDLSSGCFKQIVWNKQIGGYYLISGVSTYADQ